MKKYEDLIEALEELTVTTIWRDKVLTAAKPGCADALLDELFGLDITRYASGNIKEAILNGESISNNRAHNLQHLDLTSLWFEEEDGEYDVAVGEGVTEHPLFKFLPREHRVNLKEAIRDHQADIVIDSKEFDDSKTSRMEDAIADFSPGRVFGNG